MPPAPHRTDAHSSLRTFPRERWSDEELVGAVANGDDRAMQAIWKRHKAAVRGALFSALGPDPTIEDLSQEVFLSLARRAHRLKEPSALKAYLLGSAVRIAASERRRRGRFSRWLNIWRTDATRATVGYPEVENRDALRSLFRVLDRVPDRARAAFILRYVEELAPPDVAVALNVSLATAKRAIADGRDRVMRLAAREPALVDYLGRYSGGDHE